MNTTRPKFTGTHTSLTRGSACMNCRRRKLRCDGTRPVCNKCLSTDRAVECGYTDVQTRSRTQILEENIAVLEARIRELEYPDNVPASGPILLHNPLSGILRPGQPSHTPRRRMVPVASSPELSYLSEASSSADSTIEYYAAASEIGEDLPPDIASRLLDHFFAHSSQLGWFMHPSRFRNALLQLPEGHNDRPIPALINAVYLLGTTILLHSTDSRGGPPIDESVFLSRALCTIGVVLAGAPSHQVVQGIQAHVLLAMYHYKIGLYIEGRHQSDAAASLIMACGLHQIRSAEMPHNLLSFVDIVPVKLTEPRDQIEEGERINGMWAVFVIDRCWAVAFGAPLIIADNDASGSQIDTPWPLDMETYERGPVYPNFQSRGTLRNFLAGINTSWPWENHSQLAQLGAASALFNRATYLASCWGPRVTDINAFYANFVSLDLRIEEFKSQLISLDSLEGTTTEIVRNMHSIHLLVAAAFIQLHSAFSQQNVGSRTKCFVSAEEIVHANELSKAHEFFIINPILGIVWAIACQVFMRELIFVRSVPLGTAPLLPDRPIDTRASLDKLLATISVFAPGNAFINHQLSRVQQELIGSDFVPRCAGSGAAGGHGTQLAGPGRGKKGSVVLGHVVVF
ncbi:hypothetical protein EVG20_g4863 [Dentipellis fragilis]|uniref:Zn(2)-C6 fungal-type domain-containing protein n=1 Tax=Dentipellis fragilis TaxID=205917 RepID=A0A4Y9YWV5_9AGAM|nr:hypothetical protein EVG20_g4863 [Dentipellis fragilis]